MGLFRNLECRRITCDGKQTTIALEGIFWTVAENHADRSGITWREWAAQCLKDKPTDIGRASWLRVNILASSVQSQHIHI